MKLDKHIDKINVFLMIILVVLISMCLYEIIKILTFN